MTMLRIHSWITAALLTLCATAPLGCDAEGEDALDASFRSAPKANPPPDPFTTFAVFVADGVVPPGVQPALVGDMSFYTDVMGWSQAEIDAWRADKLAETAIRWGIPDPENNPDVVVNMGTTNPLIDYRAVVFSDRAVPETGWKNREGFLNLVVVNPAGLALGGEYAGQTVPPGTIVGGGGIYNVEVTNKKGVPTGEEIVIEFSTAEPLRQLPSNNWSFGFGFFCALESEDFGEGRAEGVITLINQPDGGLKANARNVLTFSSTGGI